ncbi:MAG: fatty acid desaturase [Actinomycetota bacterium]|nr:fatty acid desaturase [Actinomycetota bacterium]
MQERRGTLPTTRRFDAGERATLRRELAPFCAPPSARATLAVASGLMLYAGFVAGALLLQPVGWRILCSVAIAPAAGRLFMRAHDAAHGSLTSSRRLNSLLGRVAFLPTLHPESIWAQLHNREHHVFTNLRTRDRTWAPLSPAEYDGLPRWRQARYRLYRTTAGFGVYHLVELWWKQFLFPRGTVLRRRSVVHLLDQLLVLAFVGVVVGAAGVSAAWRPWPWIAATGLVLALPLVVFAYIAGFVGYCHHTHPSVRWWDDERAWRRESRQLDTAVQLTFSPFVSRLLGDVMEHPAHHIEPRVSLARLRDAQGRLRELVGDAAVVQRWSWRTHRETVARCKLYDFDRSRWQGFPARGHRGGAVGARPTESPCGITRGS